jgi:hypothetical protein
MVDPDRIEQLQCSANDSVQARHLVVARLCSPVLAQAKSEVSVEMGCQCNMMNACGGAAPNQSRPGMAMW